MDKEIVIYWWNMGHRTLDYKGTYEGYLAKKDIKVTEIESNGNKGFRFSIPLSSCLATLETFGSYEQCATEAIKVFLTLLGDKTTLFVPYRGYCRLNW